MSWKCERDFYRRKTGALCASVLVARRAQTWTLAHIATNIIGSGDNGTVRTICSSQVRRRRRRNQLNPMAMIKHAKPSQARALPVRHHVLGASTKRRSRRRTRQAHDPASGHGQSDRQASGSPDCRIFMEFRERTLESVAWCSHGSNRSFASQLAIAATKNGTLRAMHFSPITRRCRRALMSDIITYQG